MRQGSLLGIIRYDSRAFIAAVILHVALLLVLIVSVNFSESPEMQQQEVETVKAVVVDSELVQSEMKKLQKLEADKKYQEQQRLKKLDEKARQAEQRRRKEEKQLADLKKKREESKKQEQLEAKRLADLKKKQQQLEKERQAEQQRLSALQEKRKQEELAQEKARQAEEERKRKQAEEEALRKKLEEEERQRHLNSDKVKMLRLQYVKLIKRHVEKNWNKPAGASKDMSCNVVITQDRTGSVLSVKTEQCNANKAFEQSVERAVLRSSPLPDAPSADVFDRTIRFEFRSN